MGPVVIQTERLNLREWTAGDVDDLMVLATDLEVMRYINGGVPLARGDIVDFIERQTTAQRERGWCRWALEVRQPAEGEPRGVAGFCGPGCTFAPDVELGWWIHPALWGRGLATEAGQAAVGYCFGAVGFERLICCVHPENARSLRVAEKVGFVPVDEIEHRGMRIIRHELLNPRPGPPRDPRFSRDCLGG